MTAKIVNLRQARKRKSREEKTKTADQNATLHGLSKDVRELNDARKEKAKRDLDGHHRDEI